ncbi:hypothetical protein NDU88_000212 [Pleurodeles waltl]|uniref:Uncharacterized protein n=1 Tax=Pleurodeles waltl TaxID=8319 RepID=A0AAV7LU02_PLEWA|nr:hypothetical protein NDU88_000212 [Pleurodeles waltl]
MKTGGLQLPCIHGCAQHRFNLDELDLAGTGLPDESSAEIIKLSRAMLSIQCDQNQEPEDSGEEEPSS